MPGSYGASNLLSFTANNPYFYSTITSATYDFSPQYPVKPQPRAEPTAVEWLREQVDEVCGIGRAA